MINARRALDPRGGARFVQSGRRRKPQRCCSRTSSGREVVLRYCRCGNFKSRLSTARW